MTNETKEEIKEEKEVWVVSTSEEYFYNEEFESKEAAARYGREELCLDDSESFFIGLKKCYILPVPSARDFFTSLVEQSCDDLGDWSEYWERGWSKSSGLTEMVDAKLLEIQNLIMKHHKPDFYLVSNVTIEHGN